ncbi:MAG: pyruvate kinase [Armatimonadota bacterium]|nr:pyruvate kinase [bacterium]MDW8320552.1 pyruvate kinase [Armatimonadota bacterium]
MRCTKIVCTVGPATSSPERLRQLIEAGMDVARLNFSHGTHESHGQVIAHIRRISAELRKPVAILQDLCGPKLRLGALPEEGVSVESGQSVRFVLAEEGSDAENIPLPHSTLFALMRPGERILIDDGRVDIVVTQRDLNTIRGEVRIGGVLRSRKGVNLPDTRLPVTSVTERDLEDLRFGIQQGVDWVAVSFVREPEDLQPVRYAIEAASADARIIAKIEKREAIENFEQILEAADGIMIARGDLGVEMPIDEVPLIQKEIIACCNRAGKPVITATQMLESMISAPHPTRAEATDVANSILDGTDAVMLSGETAVGQYPIEAVKVMHCIASRTEQALKEGVVVQPNQPVAGSLSVTEAVAEAVCHIAYDISAHAIICATTSGSTARLVSKYRPKTPIVAFTPSESTYRQLALSWGIQPQLIPQVYTMEEMLQTAVNTAVSMGLAHEGDKVVITAGVPIGVPGNTNLIKVHTVGQPIVA